MFMSMNALGLSFLLFLLKLCGGGENILFGYIPGCVSVSVICVSVSSIMRADSNEC